MDTDRISIVSRDQSESLTVAATPTLGYTVIKAEKGPIEPILIPAGNTAAIYENFGYTSATYPDIQEVIDFNASHGVYVSAPYDVSAPNKVPAAYVTPAGILQRAEPVSITGKRIEDIELKNETITGINSIDAPQDVWVPVGKERTYFNAGIEDVHEVITYNVVNDKKVLSFNIGFDASPTLGEFANPTTSPLHFINTSAFSSNEPRRVLRNAYPAAAILVVDIPTVSEPIELYIKLGSGNQLLVQDNAGHDIGVINADTNNQIRAITIDDTQVRGAISGLYATYFSTTAIAQIWASSSFRSTVRVYWKASLRASAVYATIYQKYLSARTTILTFPKQQLGNKITFTVSEQVTPSSSASRTITGSLVEEDVDGFGAPIGFKTKLASQPFVNVAVLKVFNGDTVYTATGTSEGPVVTLPPIRLSRGSRTVTDASRELGWVEAQSPDYDHVEVFFNATPLTGTNTLFTSLANQHPLSRFIASKTVTPEQAVEGLPALAYGANYFIITNLFQRVSGFTRENYISPLVGAYAGMIAKCIDAKYGGVAPMFLNQGGVGGQLEGISVKKAIYKYSKEQLTVLDTANYNPIIRDAAYGIMVTSQKTAKPGELSDWSYIGHASAFFKFQRQIRDQVMIPQIGKPNNPYYRELRAQQALTILRPRIEGLNRIWATGIVDTTSVNTEDVLAQRKFVLAITIKVDIFSEGVQLIFTNVGQTTEL